MAIQSSNQTCVRFPKLFTKNTPWCLAKQSAGVVARGIVLIAVVLLTLTSCEPLPSRHGGKVVKVKDGDSLVLLETGNRQTEIRMAHIDAPEYSQDFGRKSRKFLVDMIDGKEVKYRIYEPEDRYGRVVAEIILNDTINVNQEMVRNGYAWHFKRYSSSYKYGKLERAARQAGIGLWANGDAVAPWEYRNL